MIESLLPAGRSVVSFVTAVLAVALLPGCGKEEAKSQARPPAEVAVVKVEPRDVPITLEYVGQTQSSHQVEIRARVNGFLDNRPSSRKGRSSS